MPILQLIIPAHPTQTAGGPYQYMVCTAQRRVRSRTRPPSSSYHPSGTRAQTRDRLPGGSAENTFTPPLACPCLCLGC
eukprot:9245059-Pyramimonas_sp.AAC.3